MKTEAEIALQYDRLEPGLNERTRREWAGSEARAHGYGGIAIVARATGIVPSTIGKAIREFDDREVGVKIPLERTRVRRAGGGRPLKVSRDPTLLKDLSSLAEPMARGDPESPLRWISKSLRTLAAELATMGHGIKHDTVGKLLKNMGFSLQANSKTLEGKQHVDRDAQFRYINEQTLLQHTENNPVISVDTKKKEIVGDYKNDGVELAPKGQPTKVDVHDFKGELGRAAPYGVYDVGQNKGYVSVGLSADTAEFAVNTIDSWWNIMGIEHYAAMSKLMITADCGGSNGYRVRLWKLELQNFADKLNKPVMVCHLPPSTSKWNKIEHKLFSFITMNWRGKPLVDYETIVSLIGATRTATGLEVRCIIDRRVYEKGRKVSDAEMETLHIVPHEFHGEWNYTIKPRSWPRDV